MRKWLSQEEKQNIGTVCCNCGATEDIEYHHIVPLLLGGNDVKSIHGLTQFIIILTTIQILFGKVRYQLSMVKKFLSP